LGRLTLNGCQLSGAAVVLAASCCAAPIAPPPAGKLYQGVYYDGVGTDTHDPTEHDVTAADVIKYESTVGSKATWVYFSDNWFESRAFPASTCAWIRHLGKIPYIRLMLRSGVDQMRAEKMFALTRIIQGDFDADLRQWARQAKDFASPVLIEWGTEPNGKWFSWNGKWNGGAARGPATYISAYRHIVDLTRSEGAHNLQWVWHVNWDDDPDAQWNRFEDYYPGDKYCDWVALSIYGPLTPQAKDDCESFASKLNHAYSRITHVAPGKPLVIAEFGCDLHNKHCVAASWARGALDEIFSGKWPGLIGFCWWNEGWQNDDVKRHNTDMIISHDRELENVFRDQFSENATKLQATAIPSK